MDMVEFLGLFKPRQLRGLIIPLRESGLTIYSNSLPHQIIGGVKQALEASRFSEERVIQCLTLQDLAEALLSLPKISENGADNMAFNFLDEIGLLTPPFCPPCQKENAEEARYCIWCGKGFPNIYCPNCKTRNVVEAIYCMECGQERK